MAALDDARASPARVPVVFLLVAERDISTLIWFRVADASGAHAHTVHTNVERLLTKGVVLERLWTTPVDRVDPAHPGLALGGLLDQVPQHPPPARAGRVGAVAVPPSALMFPVQPAGIGADKRRLSPPVPAVPSSPTHTPLHAVPGSPRPPPAPSTASTSARSRASPSPLPEARCSSADREQ